MPDDATVAEPEALGVVEVDRAATWRDWTPRPSLFARHPDPGDHLVTFREEILDLDVKVGRARP